MHPLAATPSREGILFIYLNNLQNNQWNCSWEQHKTYRCQRRPWILQSRDCYDNVFSVPQPKQKEKLDTDDSDWYQLTWTTTKILRTVSSLPKSSKTVYCVGNNLFRLSEQEKIKLPHTGSRKLLKNLTKKLELLKRLQQLQGQWRRLL